MFLVKPLQNLGLSEKEAKIYLATLELGNNSVQTIAKKANIKRPTAYVIIEELVKKGLLSEKPTHKGNIYIAENPEKFRFDLDNKQKSFDHAFPFLQAMYRKDISDRPQVKIYEGIEGVRKVYEDTVFKTKSEVLFFSSITKINEMIPDLLQQWLSDSKNKESFCSRELINPDPEDIEYGINSFNNKSDWDVRVLPKDSPFRFRDTDNAIMENEVMIVSFKEKLFTTLIQSKAIVESMRALYELAWQSATPIKKYIN